MNRAEQKKYRDALDRIKDLEKENGALEDKCARLAGENRSFVEAAKAFREASEILVSISDRFMPSAKTEDSGDGGSGIAR